MREDDVDPLSEVQEEIVGKMLLADRTVVFLECPERPCDGVSAGCNRLANESQQGQVLGAVSFLKKKIQVS